MVSRLITPEEVRLFFKINKVDIDLTDDEINKFIDMVTKSELAQLGVSLEPQYHNYTYYTEHPILELTLPLPNVKAITKINVNGRIIPSEHYEFDEKNGIIHFGHHYEDNYYHHRWSYTTPNYIKGSSYDIMSNHFDFHNFVGWHIHNHLDFNISYITQFDDSVLDILKPLLLDSLLLSLALPNQDKNRWGVIELTEGDDTIKWGSDFVFPSFIYQRINNNRKKLDRMFHKSTVMMI